MAPPQLAVAVASHNRPMRLRWLLHALAEQNLERGRFEVIVAHDSQDAETEALLRGHELAASGTLRHLRFEPSTGSSAGRRNAAWRASSAQLVLFTDDDCRPPPDWLAQALDAAAAHPGMILQGRTRPEPLELHGNGRAPWRRTQHIDPPTVWAETCNILYPRSLLEAVGGFVEEPPLLGGEDTDLAERARAAGSELVGVPAMLTYHAIDAVSLPARLRSQWRWRDLPLLFRRHPQLRSELTLRVFWRPSHAWLALACVGLAIAPRRPVAAALVLPWAHSRMPSYGGGLRGRLRALSELPASAALDAVEAVALVRGSVRHRSLVL